MVCVCLEMSSGKELACEVLSQRLLLAVILVALESAHIAHIFLLCRELSREFYSVLQHTLKAEYAAALDASLTLKTLLPLSGSVLHAHLVNCVLFHSILFS